MLRTRSHCGRVLGWLLAAALSPAWASGALPVDAETAALQDEAVGLHQAIGARRLVLLGEKHGTREIPRFVASLLRQWPRDTPRVLALELPRGQQFALDAYFASDGGAVARETLRRTPYWEKADNQHDGRRSEDMLDLLATIHAERRAGAAIRVLGFDANPGTYTDHHARDEQMAAFLRAESARDRSIWLVLTGNVHAMRSRPPYAPVQMQQPMGSLIADLAPFSVSIDARESTIWACQSSGCGPQLTPPRPHLRPGPLDDGVYDWRVVLPRLSVARLLGAPAPQAAAAAWRDYNPAPVQPLMEFLMSDTPPDRLSVNPRSPHFNDEVLSRGIGVRFNGVERHNIEEYCISEGWVRYPVGTSLDRRGNPMTMKASGTVEVWFQDTAPAAE